MSSSGSALYVSSSTSLPPWSDTSSAVESLVLLPKPYPMQPPSILHASFNQEADCFSVGTTEGFAVFDADPFSESFRRSFSSGGVSLVQMLFRYNILVLVAAPEPNKVMIWDDHLKKCVFALLFRSEVKAVRLRPDSILVVMLQKIYVYDFADFKLVHQIETMENPLGLCEVSQKGSMVVVCLGLQKGFVMVEHYAMRKSKHIMAHNSSVAFVALVNDGSLLATASSCGTLVRVFSTKDGSLLKELRRGSERAVICSLSFSADAQWLAVSSDKGTVHVFSLKIDPGYLRIACSDKAETNSLASYSVSRLSFIKGFLPNYFSSEWSVAQFHVKEGLQHAVGFGHQEHTVAIIGSDGRFYRCKFDPVVGGEMIQLESHSF